jgi:outer membrane protein OmpA-like peptidoglycan-associated protein
MVADIRFRKTYNKTIALVFIFACFFTQVMYGQLNKAHDLFNNTQYVDAIKLYEKALKKKEDTLAVLNIAEAYRRINETEKAEFYYKRATELYPSNTEIQLIYGQLLKTNNKHNQAKEVFIVYASKNPQDERGNKYILSCDKVKSWMVETPNFSVSNLEEINTSGSEFSAVPYENGIAFVTDRFMSHVDGIESGTQAPYLRISFAEMIDSSYKKPKEFGGNFNNEYHNGPVSFNKAQNIAFLTRVEISKNNTTVDAETGKKQKFVNKPQLFYTEKKGNKWDAPKSFEHNNPLYTYAHPTLTPDGKTLFFASDMKGGSGALDIYTSTFSGGKWSEPKNIGTNVNTKGSEAFPFAYSNDTLYFSSNGHEGYGGLDIYFSVLKDNVWQKPQHLRNNINSSKDDFGIAFIDAKNGFFSSNRDGGKGDDDIYQFVLVKEMGEKTKVQGIFLYSELEPASNKIINLVDDDGNIIMTTTTDEKGKFAFDNLTADQNYVFTIDEDDPNLNLNSKIYLTNDDGQKVLALNQPEPGMFKFRMLPEEKISALTPILAEDYQLTFKDIYGQLFDKLPGDFKASLEIQLVDEQGDIIYTTVSDDKGQFAFENVLDNQDYKIVLKPDTSVGMIFTNAKGDKVSDAKRDASGKYTYMRKEVVVAQSLFGRVFQTLPGDISKPMEVYLVDDEGNIVYTAVTDKNGNFVFENLPPDQQYLFKLAADDGKVKMLMLDEQGEPLEMASKNDKGQYVYEKQKPVTSLFGKVYETLPGDFSQRMEVYLVDEEGNVVYKTYTDEKGNFNFENLPPDHNYKLRLQNSEDDLSLVLLDEFGQPQSVANKNNSGDFSVGKQTKTNALLGNIYQTLPGDFSNGMEVYLVDDNGNIVYRTMTDSKGNFNFQNLPPDHNFKLKLKDAGDEFNMVILNDFGEQQKLKVSGNGNVDYEKPKKTALFGNLYQTLPGDFSEGMEVYLVDDDGNIVYKTKADKNGNFDFQNLPADKNYTIKLKDSQDDLNIVMLNEFGEMIAPKPKTNKISGQAFVELPGDFNNKMEVYLMDDNGNVVFKTFTDEKGNFNFDNLPPDKNYIIKFNDADGTMQLALLDENGNQQKQLKQTKDGKFEFAYLPPAKDYIPMLTLEDDVIKILADENFTVFNLYFDYDSYALLPNARKELDKLILIMKKNPHVAIKVKGHTDSKGAEEYNQKLSERRAGAVANYVTSKGIDKKRVNYVGLGEMFPIAPNDLPDGSDNPEGRKKNRRTEISFTRASK